MEGYLQHIEIQSDKRFGQPCIKGTRISVADILAMLASGMDIPEILEDFPELHAEQVQAAILFAVHRENVLRIAS